MPLITPDEMLKLVGLTKQEMTVEIACRLFDAGKLHLWPAAQLAGMSRVQFEDALIKRGIAPYPLDADYVCQEFEYVQQSSLQRSNK